MSRQTFSADCVANNYPSVDEDGTVSFRKSLPTELDEEIEAYVEFVQRYASLLMGSCKLNAYFKVYPSDTIFDAINPSDEAFATLHR